MGGLAKRLAAGAAVVVWTVSACGGPARKAESRESAEPDPVAVFTGRPAETITQEAIAGMQSLSSVRASGKFGAADGSSLTVDLRFDTAGTCLGSLRAGSATIRLLRVDGDTYLKASRAAWREYFDSATATRIARTLKGKWAKVRGSDGGYDKLCGVDPILDRLGVSSSSSNTTRVGAVVDLGGRQAVELIASERNSAATITIWVAVDGAHEVVAVERQGGFEPGRITFSDFDEPIAATAPAKREYLDLTAGS